MTASPRIAVLGAGSIGCYVGGVWAAAGLPVTFIGREQLQRDIAANGLTLSDFTGRAERLTAAQCAFTTDPAALGEADIILLTVKGGGTAAAGAEIAKHAREGTAIISFQNGVGNTALLEQTLGPGFAVIQGMVPFNVVYLGDGCFHKGAAGALWVEDRAETQALAARVEASREPLRLSSNMMGLAWGKLLINLNNAVNALSGRTLLEQLGERRYRRVVAASQREALGVLWRARIKPARVGPLPPPLVPLAIGAPDWLFRNLFARGWKIDAKARSSMADDLAHGRRTEVEQLNGEVVRLARKLGIDAPVNRRIVALIEAAEAGAPPLGPLELQRAVLGG